MTVIPLDEIPPETLEDLVRNVEIDLVLEWGEQEAHYRALLDGSLDEENIAYELGDQYYEGDESVIAAFNSWLALI